MEQTGIQTRRGFLAGLGTVGLIFVSTAILPACRQPSDHTSPDSEGKRVQPMTTPERTTGYVYDPIFLKHTQPGHPESARRLEAIMEALESAELLENLQQIPSRAATAEELALVHSPSYAEHVQRICQAGGGHLDPDTYTNTDTYSAAIVAAGSLIDLTVAVIDGQVRNGFGFVRPPGHHALPNRAMGFCIFNNIAIAAKAAQSQRGIERVAIVDIDVHHGNGTQAVFEEDPTVLYISTHQYPYYPGTGRIQEIGRGAGKGTILNVPLPAGVGDEGFRKIYTEVLLPALRRFRPQLLLVSAGYDCHWNDPLAGLGLSLTGMAWISQTLVEVAEEVCDGRIVFTLEGGYNLDVLRAGVINSIKALSGQDDFIDPLGPSPRREPDVTGYIAELKTIHHIGENNG